MASKIYLIRHGITEGNQKKWFYGAADIPLAEEGREALRRLVEAGAYPAVPEDADFYTTGLIRTEETFAILFGEKKHQTIAELREMRFGEYECKTWEELKAYEDFDKWAWDTTGDVGLPGGETKNQFAARISGGIERLLGLHRLKELSHRHSGKDAVSVVVCHGGVISAAMQELFPGERETMWDWMTNPGYGYKIELEDGEPAGYEKVPVPQEQP